MHIVVTAPKQSMLDAAREAANCISAGGGTYFRRLSTLPKNLHVGDRVYYVEAGFLRGFAVVSKIMSCSQMACDTTVKEWAPGVYVFMDATTWQWVRPIPMKGFQGWRYYTEPVEVIGGWLDPKPKLGPRPVGVVGPLGRTSEMVNPTGQAAFWRAGE